MSQHITIKSRPELIDLYRNSPMFNRIVQHAEATGMTYEQMLEMAVIEMAKDADNLRDSCIKYATRFGALPSA
jgi:hypothetical protein